MPMITGTFRHTFNLLRNVQTSVDGTPAYTWQKQNATPIKGRLDLTFQRFGKDVPWTPEAGRPPDRNGVLFCSANLDIRPQDRVQMLSGPYAGIIMAVEGVNDLVPTMSKVSHWELGVKEVQQQPIHTQAGT